MPHTDLTSRYSYYVLGVLFCVNVLNLADRQVVYILFPLLKADLQFTDTQLGALGALPFALFYSFMGVPLGWVADRWHRIRLITLGLTAWSGLTTLSGMARGFWSLFVVRVGVGIGESSCAPAGQTILSDYFPPAKRSTILAIFNCGVPIGHGLGLYLGGYIAQHWGWRWAFYLLGIPGLLFALLVANLKEPVRGQMEEEQRKPALSGNSRGAVKQLLAALRSSPSLRWHLAGMALIGFAVNGAAIWLPTFLVRVRGMSVETAGEISGVSAIVAGLFGTFLGGVLADRWLTRRKNARMFILVVRSLLVIPFLFGILFISSPALLVAVIIVGSCVSAVWFGPASAVVHDLVDPEIRSMAVAVYVLSINLAAGASPIIIGKLTDLSGDPLFLQYALLIAPAGDLLAAVCHYCGSRRLVADLQARAQVAAAA
ncbi:MAG TPA: MFS transporter [Candidatus Binatia bacterium]|jgi:MFS family permease|nr:MFS transporter [Candidatus Binatia bacterium]